MQACVLVAMQRKWWRAVLGGSVSDNSVANGGSLCATHTHTHNESFATTGGPMGRGGIGECDVDGWSRVSDVDSTGSFKYITLVNVSV